MKTCTKCKIEKSLDEFHKHPTSKDGYQSHCKLCQKELISYYFTQTEKGRAYVKKYREENRDLYRKANRKWQKKNKHKVREWVYKFAKENKEQWIAIQDKYQSRIPPSVYCIKYNDEVIYVGQALKPQNRVNLHISTIKTGNNLTKVNKLHSYLGFDKSAFSYEFLEQCKPDMLHERERYWEEYYNAKGNYKRIFGKVKSINQILKENGFKTGYEKYSNYVKKKSK